MVVVSGLGFGVEGGVWVLGVGCFGDLGFGGLGVWGVGLTV